MTEEQEKSFHWMEETFMTEEEREELLRHYTVPNGVPFDIPEGERTQAINYAAETLQKITNGGAGPEEFMPALKYWISCMHISDRRQDYTLCQTDMDILRLRAKYEDQPGYQV